jgi:hypothetical protein
MVLNSGTSARLSRAVARISLFGIEVLVATRVRTGSSDVCGRSAVKAVCLIVGTGVVLSVGFAGGPTSTCTCNTRAS